MRDVGGNYEKKTAKLRNVQSYSHILYEHNSMQSKMYEVFTLEI